MVGGIPDVRQDLVQTPKFRGVGTVVVAGYCRVGLGTLRGILTFGNGYSPTAPATTADSGTVRIDYDICRFPDIVYPDSTLTSCSHVTPSTLCAMSFSHVSNLEIIQNVVLHEPVLNELRLVRHHRNGAAGESIRHVLLIGLAAPALRDPLVDSVS